MEDTMVILVRYFRFEQEPAESSKNLKAYLKTWRDQARKLSSGDLP